MEERRLKMSFDPHTIEHLGIKMYSVLPNAVAELIANAYDAEATRVDINLQDNEGCKSISVTDNGVGMSFDEINEKFLRIGRKRRSEDNGLSPNRKRKVTGRKGLGKLAFFGIGDVINVTTKQAGKCVEFTLRWTDLISSDKSEYEPSFNILDCDINDTGTTIKLSELKRKTGFDEEGLAVSLSKLFNLFNNTFEVYITKQGGNTIKIDDKLKYKDLTSQVEWILPNSNVTNEYLVKRNVSGKIIATEKPLKPGLRGITLYAHGRMVNTPQFFGASESSHVFSYLTGWLDVDFVDELEDDVISTDRQSLSWDLPVTSELQNHLREMLSLIEKDWRTRRKEERQKRISNQTNIDVNKWYSKLPTTVKSGVENIVSSIVENSELETEKQNELVDNLHRLLPEYTYYHYRHLHEIVRKVSEKGYQNQDYYRAFEETMKRYILEVQRKSGLTDTEVALMNKAFGKEEKQVLKVTKKYKRINGDNFNTTTIENIEEGQRWLSAGIMTGARNPVAHEEISELQESGLFTEEDCLDSLSLLSHLFRRLDDAVNTKR
ncbi:MAG: TIGR02391 family protein [Prevotella sp.]|nr:TIGR02391 family protein [Prevotella sp.]